MPGDCIHNASPPQGCKQQGAVLRPGSETSRLEQSPWRLIPSDHLVCSTARDKLAPTPPGGGREGGFLRLEEGSIMGFCTELAGRVLEA